MRLLLLSNSTIPGEGYLTWARPHIGTFLGREVRQVAFVPYASVSMTWDEHAARAREVLGGLGYEVLSVHQDPAALQQADAIAVGGGNTFRLLAQMHDTGLLGDIRERVRAGAPYLGWSAGSNVACPTIRTTNDMPIIQPASFAALNLVPFQINPHFIDVEVLRHGGETRTDRIREFLELNRGQTVIALPEGTGLRVEANEITCFGRSDVLTFSHASPVHRTPAGGKIGRPD